MTFNKILVPILVVVMALTFSSCGDEPDNKLDSDDFAYFATESTLVTKGSTAPIVVNVIFSSTRGHDVSASAEFELILDNATEGVDFEIGNESNQLQFDSTNGFRQSITIIPLEDAIDTPDESTIEIQLTNLSSGTAGFPGPDRRNSRHVINMVEIDCDWEISGTYSVTTVQTNPAGCEGVTNMVEVSIVGEGLFQITDITGGMYANCYGQADNPGIITGECNGPGLVIDNQPDVVYGDDVFNGSGQINPDGTFEIEWSNGFGDSGYSIFVPED